MDRSKKIIYFILFILFLVWIFYPPSSSEEFPVNNIIEKREILLQDNFSNINELHWTHMPLKYKLNNLGCSEVQIKHFLKGLNEINNLTEGLVSFVETFDGDYSLKVNCVDRDFLISSLTTCETVFVYGNPQKINWYNESYLNKSERRFVSATLINQTKNAKIYDLCSFDLEDVGFNLDFEVLGEGGPSEIEGNRILKGEINLYQGFEANKTCTYPVKEIHEILHSFGFDHVPEPEWDPYWGYVDWEPTKDIMFPNVYCQSAKKLNDHYVSCLKYIYSNGADGSCGTEVNFSEFLSQCSDGWHPVEGTESCCPEPNMIVVEGYCSY